MNPKLLLLVFTLGAATLLAQEPKPAATPAAAPPKGVTATPSGLLLNFQGAALNDVLNYLSDAAGFVIVQESPVQGTVNLVSRQPLTPEEAIDALNTVLADKGYTAIQNGRILKIVNKKDAQKRDIPVNSGTDPAKIPRKDAMVTQILPLRFGEAGKLVENLRPLLSDTATITANDGSNAVILTDTQTNIHRIAQIIQALDTSVASISNLAVIPLKFSDATQVAEIITKLFSTTAAPANNQGGGGRRGGGGGFPGFGAMFGGGGGTPATPASEARSAAERVVAVADAQSNSVIISAPEETIPTIREMITQIDTSVTDITDTRIFRLVNADSVELAAIVNELFADPNTQANRGNNNQRGNNNNRNGGRGQGGFPGFPFGGQQAPQGSAQSERSLRQDQVKAVGDPRTNSLLVTAAREAMPHIEEMISRLDSTTAKKQHVYTHALTHGDPDNVANVLRGMLGQQTTTTQTNRLNDRQTTGAQLSTPDFSSTNGNGSNNR